MSMSPSIASSLWIASDTNSVELLAQLYIAHRGKFHPEIAVLADMYARIRQARSRVGISQEEFAARLGVSRGAVAQWEMEKGTSPSVKNLEQVAIHSGFAFEWLATGRGPRVFGDPMINEAPASYGIALSDDEQLVVAAMRKMKPAQRASLIGLIVPSK